MRRDVWRFLGLSCAAALAGAAVGHVFLGLWAGALLYCYWQWRNLVRLSPWIRHHHIEQRQVWLGAGVGSCSVAPPSFATLSA